MCRWVELSGSMNPSIQVNSALPPTVALTGEGTELAT